MEDLYTTIVHQLGSSDPTKRGAKLTRRRLADCINWIDWRDSEWKQLDQYEAQATFGEPQSLPTGANVLN